MAYTNALFYIDYEGGSDTARTALTTVTASNPSGSVTRMNKVAHGLVTGAVVDATLFTAWLNVAWKITVVDADNFDLDGAVWQATADTSGTITPRGGSSKADAWQTISTGASSSRIAAGDTCRVMASPDETLVGNATWTQYNKVVTLAGAVTQSVTDCETVWTGSANVTVTADAGTYKQGTKSFKAIFASGFTTGKAAYFATGTLDLSTYQQVTFWINTNGSTVAAGTLSLRLCSDAIGDVTVDTINIPLLTPGTTNWMPITVNVGSNLGSAIASIALYCDIDPGTLTMFIDNITACKAVGSADALTLTSLIGKVWNKSWVAGTTYAADDIRRPTQSNRNGLCYKVTAGGGGAAGVAEPTWPQEIGVTVVDGALTWTCLDVEETWYALQSISGVTLRIDNTASTTAISGRGYDGTTETVATYKRETTKQAMQASALTTLNQPSRTGTAASPITYSGGWDRTSMASKTGETWFDGQNGYSYGFGAYTVGADHIMWENINACRFGSGLLFYSSDFWTVLNTHISSCDFGIRCFSPSFGATMKGINVTGASNYGVQCAANVLTGSITNMRCSNTNGNEQFLFQGQGSYKPLRMANIVIKNGNTYGLRNISDAEITIYNLTTANNTNSGIYTPNASLYLYNSKILDTTPFTALTAFAGQVIFSQKHGQIADAHLLTLDGGTIISDTAVRHTASGISWKFRPTSVNRHSRYPMPLSVLKVACTANVAVSVQVWAYRDNTNIMGTLRVKGYQLAGVPLDVTVSVAPTINTWTLSSALTFTPTENGVIEVLFEVYDGVGTSNNFWIDDLVVS